jgi:transcriptional regulator with XRE-family HTH domain
MEKENFLKLLGERVRVRREFLDMSQDELARHCNYSDRSAITIIEKGRRDIPVWKIMLIANALKTTVVELVNVSSSDISTTISVRERDLLSAFSELNELGKSKIIEQINDLVGLTKYTEK